jgi:hypothetical protein
MANGPQGGMKPPPKGYSKTTGKAPGGAPTGKTPGKSHYTGKKSGGTAANKKRLG